MGRGRSNGNTVHGQKVPRCHDRKSHPAGNFNLYCLFSILQRNPILFCVKDIDPADIQTIGLANQRETVVTWSRKTGEPLHNAILWHDVRTAADVEYFKKKIGREKVEWMTGLPLSTYFSASKMHWLFKNESKVRAAFEQDDLMIGTVDTWLLWNLTGGVAKGVYLTDVTNASRTMLMDLETLEWSPALLHFFELPLKVKHLARIVSCSEIYGKLCCSKIKDTPISGCMGDQQAALVVRFFKVILSNLLKNHGFSRDKTASDQARLKSLLVLVASWCTTWVPKSFIPITSFQQSPTNLGPKFHRCMPSRVP